MITFVLLCAALLALALALLLWPLLGRGGAAQIARDRTNLDIYRDQFDELEGDLKAGALSGAQYEAARTDLQRRLLEEAQAAPVPASTGRAGRRLPVVIAVIVPVVAAALYLQVGNPEGLTATPHPADKLSSITPEKFAEMAGKLAARMQSNPDDAEGWMMLGRAYRAMDRNQEAADAFARSVAIKGDDPAVLADYAEALALAAGRSLTGEPTRLLGRALELDPDNEKALALSGSAAFERKDYPAAIRHWETLLRKTGATGDLAQALEAGIAEARALSGGKKSASGRTAAKLPAVSGTVGIDAKLRAHAGPDDTVFIFARAAEGPRMPLAILRIRVKDLPYRFSLDDSMAMAPERRLSGFPAVVVGARVSKSGNAMPSPGDLEGLSTVVKPGTTGVNVMIDRVVE